VRVEGCRLKDVTFILAEMRARRRTGGEGETGRGGLVDGWLEEALEQLFKS